MLTNEDDVLLDLLDIICMHVTYYRQFDRSMGYELLTIFAIPAPVCLHKMSEKIFSSQGSREV